MAPEGYRDSVSKHQPKDSKYRSQKPKRSEHDSKRPQEDSTNHRRNTSRDRSNVASRYGSVKSSNQSEIGTPSTSRAPRTASPIRPLRRVGTAQVSRSAGQTHDTHLSASPDRTPDVSQSVSTLTAAYDARKSAVITAAEDRLLDSLETESIKHQIATLKEIFKLLPPESFPQLSSRLATYTYPESLKKAYEGLKKVNLEFEIKEQAAIAAGDRKSSSNKTPVLVKRAIVENHDALEVLYMTLGKGWDDHTQLVLEYIDLMKVEHMYCRSTHATAHIATKEKPGDRVLRQRCTKGLVRDSVVGRCLNLCYKAYLHRGGGADWKKGSSLEDHESLVEEAANTLPQFSGNGEAMEAIKELAAIGLMWEARRLCAFCLRRYKKPEFEKELLILVGDSDLKKTVALCDARPDSRTYSEKLLDVAARHKDQVDVANKCLILLEAHPSHKYALAALLHCLSQLKETEGNQDTAISIWMNLISAQPSHGFHRYLNKVLVSQNDKKFTVGFDIWDYLARNPTRDVVAERLRDRYKNAVLLASPKKWEITCPVCMKEPLMIKCSRCKNTMYCDRCADNLIKGKEECYGCKKSFRSEGSGRLYTWENNEQKLWTRVCMNALFRSIEQAKEKKRKPDKPVSRRE